jgi:diaminopimelate decarboxylase
MNKLLPFNAVTISTITAQYPTPYYVYDTAGIQSAARKLNAAFAWNSGFRNFFAVKATPNPAILKLLTAEGMGLDCSSLPELMLAERAGVTGEGIMFSSNDTAASEFAKAHQLEATINLDDISHLDELEKAAGLPDLLCFRYNPGNRIKGNAIIGQPEQAKFGVPHEQLVAAYRLAQQKGIRRFGLHAMIASNNLDYRQAASIAQALFALAEEVKRELQIEFEFINLGGGIGIPYRPEEAEFDLEAYAAAVKTHYQTELSYQPKLYMECGRYMTGPYGFLVSRVLHIKRGYKTFLGLDASMHNLMRPGMYGAYHHITILGKEQAKPGVIYDVTGSLCENNDKFAIDRQLPQAEIGDIVVIHDAGAHGHAMGFNYNGKLRSAELLLNANGEVTLIRRAETPDDYFATLV